MKNKPHLTAIARTKPSAPMTLLNKQHRLTGRTLDYGCGRGFDADCFDMERYDPHYFPKEPDGLFDTITCNYVLNVISRTRQADVLSHIRSFLKPDGVAYVTVRRDITHDYKTKNSVQRVVRLPLPIIEENDGYCIYFVLKYLEGDLPLERGY